MGSTMKKLTTTLFAFFLANFATAQDMPLSQVLIPGEDWQLVSNHNGFADAPQTWKCANVFRKPGSVSGDDLKAQ